jgi:hypothetical protein
MFQKAEDKPNEHNALILSVNQREGATKKTKENNNSSFAIVNYKQLSKTYYVIGDKVRGERHFKLYFKRIIWRLLGRLRSTIIGMPEFV